MSKTNVQASPCKSFFEELASAGERALVIDYDGTVAPFTPHRDKAFPYAGIPELLTRIMDTAHTRVIMISSRAAHQLLPLLGMGHPPEMWGSYGLERIYRDGKYQGASITDDSFDGLAEAEILLEEAGLGKYIEVNPATVAVHWRSLASQDVLMIRTEASRIMKSIAASSDLVVAEFEGGLEIRVPSACTGDAIRSVLRELDPSTPIAYMGDDTPDEDAFRMLNGRGLTVLVGPRYRFTAAQMWLRPPEELIGFLQNWLEICVRGAA